MELDEIMINDIVENNDKNKEYIDKTIYIIHYPENELSVSYGILNKIYEDKFYDFQHKCSTKFGSSGSPILTLNNRMKYANEEYDITIIEIKEKDGINNYLELDDNIINDIIKNNNRKDKYKDETI